MTCWRSIGDWYLTYQWNREHRDEGWDKGNRDEWRGIRDVMEIGWTLEQKRYSGGWWSGTDLSEIHWWSISNKWSITCSGHQFTLLLMANSTIRHLFDQSFWSFDTTVHSIWAIDLLARSVAPSVWGWNAVDMRNLLPINLCNSFQNMEVNLMSQSDTINSGIPWSLTTSFNINHTSPYGAIEKERNIMCPVLHICRHSARVFLFLCLSPETAIPVVLLYCNFRRIWQLCVG